MAKDKIDSFLDDDDALDAFLDSPLKDAPAGNEDPVMSLGKAVMAALQNSMKSASPFQKGQLIESGAEFAQSGAPGVVAGMAGQDVPADSSMPAKMARQLFDPAVIASLGAAGATGGASLPVQAGMAALATGAGRALQEGTRQALAGEDNTAAVLTEGGKAAAWAGSLQGVVGGAGKAFDAIKPNLKKLGAQLIRTTSGVPEKYGAAVLDNPDILNKAHTLVGARQIYKATVKDMGGVQDFLQKKTGKAIPSNKSVLDLINDAVPKMGKKELGLEEALAARQGVSNMLMANKFSTPQYGASKASLVEIKNNLDEYIESGLPGFKKANMGYFEANAREAFESWLPQNKNLSPNVLRSLGALSSIGAASLLNAPKLMLAALPMSPKATGLAIRGASAAFEPSILAAKFASRIAAARGIPGSMESGGSRGDE